MNILSMLARLEGALGCSNLTRELVLSKPKTSHKDQIAPGNSATVNLVVGYNGSPRSQSALDLTLWIAHQTRLATGKPVHVQVVYVINLDRDCQIKRSQVFASPAQPVAFNSAVSSNWRKLEQASVRRRQSEGPVAQLSERAESSRVAVQDCQMDQFERADQILWQARTLADEWRGSLKTHLRFGKIAKELRSVVTEESASLLVLGCESADHAIVEQLQANLRCPILGIPAALAH